MSSPLEILETVIIPALEDTGKVLKTKNLPEAAVFLLAVAIQESHLQFRKQFAGGPARGLFQMESEPLSMMTLVMKKNPELRAMLPTADPKEMWNLLEFPENDKYGVYIARTALKSDPAPIPRLGNVEGAWEYYLKHWRPGKPRKEKWAISYEAALGAWRSLNQRESITDSRTVKTALGGGTLVVAGQTISYLAGMPLGFWIFLAVSVGVLGAIVYFRWEDFRDRLT